MGAIKTVAMIGLGSIGSYFAPRLESVLGYGNFRVIAGGERKERLEREGTTINGVNHKFKIVTPEEQDPADLILVSVKHHALPQAIKDMAGQVGENTAILSLMNGIDSEEMIGETYGMDKVLYGYVRASAALSEDRVANYEPTSGLIVCGEADNTVLSPRMKAVDELFTAAGINHDIPKDMIKALWLKFMVNVSENHPTAILKVPFGATNKNAHVKAVSDLAIKEIVAVAAARGITITQEDVDEQYAATGRLAYGIKSSMQQDIDNGRKPETDMLAGTVVALGKEFGIETPVCELLYHATKVLEDKNAGLI